NSMKTVYTQITGILEHRFMPRARQCNLLLAVARACVHGGDYRAAADYFVRVLALTPEDRAVRSEYAGVLLQDDRPKSLLALYGGEASRTAERFLIATAHRRLGDQAAAESECRIALKKNPGNVQISLPLAEALRTAGQTDEA